MNKFFGINVSKYVPDKQFEVVRPASLDNPRNNAVMFITEKFMGSADSLYKCDKCLVFWEKGFPIPEDFIKRHAVYECKEPRREYCRFYKENNITYYPEVDKYELVNGAYIAKKAKIGRDCRIFPGAYIGGGSDIG